jgi:nitroimidazol reductase NimA-like FMN-containing flavoprotein (pyridoxamine 5'-phosphate oxidase superfamily)
VVVSLTRLRRHPERVMPDTADRDALLAEALVAHVGLCIDGVPVVIPLLFQHEGDVVYFHGSPASRAIRHLASGAPVCITVTTVEGLVASRTALNHSANYRSVVAFGRGRPVADLDAKRAVLERMTARLLDGRAADRDYMAATPRDLKTTLMAAVTIEAWSGKRRTGPPLGPLDADLPDDHEAAGMWAGVVELGAQATSWGARPIDQTAS